MFENLSPFVKDAVKRLGFTTPTSIQKDAVPVVLDGKDVIASAETGSGKTLAFLLPLLTRLDNDKSAHGLVLAPTRELAEQIATVAQSLLPHSRRGFKKTKERPIQVCLLIGGVSMGPQLRSLAHKPRLIVGTPGRILDHKVRGSLKLAQTRIVVLDECDRMLDMGFTPQVERIMAVVPSSSQTLLFTATLIDELCLSKWVKDPVVIGKKSTVPVPLKIVQSVLKTPEKQKNETLIHALQQRHGASIVFVRTQVRVDNLARVLNDAGFEAALIHGGKSQRQRQQALMRFRTGKSQVLVATDIAARGLDVPQVRFVVSYDLPQCPSDFVHRMGRTGRAGRDGESVSLVTNHEQRLWRSIERVIVGKSPIHRHDNRFVDKKAASPKKTRKKGGVLCKFAYSPK